MFGMGFSEIILVVIVAIIFLGPDKLPQAMVDIAKFFRAFKKTINDAKENLDREISLNEIKEEALSYKKSLEEEAQSLTKGITLDDLDPVLDSEVKNKISQGQKVSAEDRERVQKRLLEQEQKPAKSASGADIDFKNATAPIKES